MKRKKLGRRALSFLLAVTLCICLLPVNNALAYGDAMDLGAVKKLLNAEKLYPQRTGYEEIDGMLERIVAPYRGKDTYTQVKAMYDWAVDNITYSWEGYSQNWAPAYNCFTLKYDLAYETGLPQAYPMDMIYRAYHALTAKKAVCYDWAILFTVMARYIGIESYVRTGTLTIGSWQGHHGWTELRLGGKGYIFDAQQDNRSKGLVGWIIHDHFGIAPENARRFAPETAVNAARDKTLLPVTAERIRTAQVKVTASRSGTVNGAGSYPWGSEVTLTTEGEDVSAQWYSQSGKLLAEGSSYTVTLDGDASVLVLFDGDRFVDIPENAWYLADVCEAAQRGYVAGMTPVTFQAGGQMTRAMAAGLLAKAAGADISAAAQAPFTDVDQGKWYAKAVNWAYENGLVYGVTEESFDPMGKVTREQAAAMLMRLLRKNQVQTAGEGTELGFTDAEEISAYALPDLRAAKELGILSGYKDGTVKPKAVVTRAEGTALLMRTVRILEAA